MKNYLETTTHNIAWFKNAEDAGELIISPQFQRHLVWTEKQMSYLMDSILHAYPIPELYIQENISSEGKSQFTVVDGQQRLRSILQFINGGFEIDETQSSNWGGLAFDDLTDEDKKRFFSYKFVIRILPEMEDAELRSIFQRINRYNYALNSQELRQSTYSGDFIKLMNEIADSDYWVEIDLFSASRIRRMLDVEFISELAIAYLNGFQNKKNKLDFYYMLYEQEFSEETKIRSLFNTIVPEIIKVLPDIKKTRWCKLIDFYTLFLVMAEFYDRVPLSSDMRTLLGDKLRRFSALVNEVQSPKEIQTFEEFSENILVYATGVRNSSDLASRKYRHNSLKNEIEPLFAVK